jgi:hypothetical protein
MFDALRTAHYEDLVAQLDFFGRRERPLVRLVAGKPAPELAADAR